MTVFSCNYKVLGHIVQSWVNWDNPEVVWNLVYRTKSLKWEFVIILLVYNLMIGPLLSGHSWGMAKWSGNHLILHSHEWQSQNFSLHHQYNIKQTSDENKGKYQLGNYKLIQYQILQSNIIRMIWQIVMRITNEIMNGSQMVNKWFSIKYLSCRLRRKLNSLIMMWLLLNEQKLMLRLWKISQKKMRRVRMKLAKDTQLWNAKEASKNHQEPQGDAHGEHFIKSLD